MMSNISSMLSFGAFSLPGPIIWPQFVRICRIHHFGTMIKRPSHLFVLGRSFTILATWKLHGDFLDVVIPFDDVAALFSFVTFQHSAASDIEATALIQLSKAHASIAQPQEASRSCQLDQATVDALDQLQTQVRALFNADWVGLTWDFHQVPPLHPIAQAAIAVTPQHEAIGAHNTMCTLMGLARMANVHGPFWSSVKFQHPLDLCSHGLGIRETSCLTSTIPQLQQKPWHW